jgi:hypothetical protein
VSRTVTAADVAALLAAEPDQLDTALRERFIRDVARFTGHEMRDNHLPPHMAVLGLLSNAIVVARMASIEEAGIDLMFAAAKHAESAPDEGTPS